MKRYLAVGIVFAAALLVLAGCEGSQGPQGPKGDTGPVGPAGPAPSAAEVQAAAELVLVGPAASAESIALGGRLYDKWWEEAGVSEPTGDNPLWALQTTNTRSDSATYRCKECHGWDYKGAGGVYSSGSHKTGFTGVYAASQTRSKEQLLDIMKGGTNYRHDFSTVLTDAQLSNLVDFLKEGLINDTIYIDYATKAARVTVDLANGEQRYSGTCSACHGDNGRQIPFHSGEGVGDVARDNPWEFIHKVRFGQPGTGMPAAITRDWSIQDVVDVLAFAQGLPEE